MSVLAAHDQALEWLALDAMGTRFELGLAGPRAAAEEALAEIERLHARWTRFASDSFLHFVEREAPRRALSLEPEDWELFETALRAHAASAGAFDIAWRSSAGSSEDIELDERTRTLRFHAPLVLDMGALAKGLALDVAGDHLLSVGVERALLHGGTSSVRAIGTPAFTVRIAGSQRDVGLRDSSLSVSAQAQRQHIQDARGNSLPRSALRAWVCAQRGLEAEAWSTTLLILERMPPNACALDWGSENA
jgi:FAD:protein FMN transferase